MVSIKKGYITSDGTAYKLEFTTYCNDHKVAKVKQQHPLVRYLTKPEYKGQGCYGLAHITLVRALKYIFVRH